VLAQDYGNFEVWVVDDGSTDGTGTIAAEFARQDDRVQVLYQENAGVAAARNLGIQRSRGTFVAPLDADDCWEPRTLSLWVQKFERSSSRIAVVYGWSLDVDEDDRPTGGFHAAQISGRVLPTLLVHNFLGNASATLIRRSVLERIGGYDATLRDRSAQGCEDWDLYLKLSQHWEFEVVPEFLVRYRRPQQSMSQDAHQMARSHDWVLRALRDRLVAERRDLPQWLYGLSRSSLYLHFSQEAQQFGRWEEAKAWSQKSWQADRVTPLLRPGWYRLRFGLRRHSGTAQGPSQDLSQRPSRWAIGLKVWVSGVLHRVVCGVG